MLREEVAVESSAPELHLRGSANWTGVIFCSILSFLHFCISLPAFYLGRWEGYLSFMFALIFAGTSVVVYFARSELTLHPRSRRIGIRNGVGPLRFERSIPFDDVHAVRLTLGHGGRSAESEIEILCDNEDIACPQTSIPRQQALYLAITLGVQLIKVSDEDEQSERSERLI